MVVSLLSHRHLSLLSPLQELEESLRLARSEAAQFKQERQHLLMAHEAELRKVNLRVGYSYLVEG